MKNDFSSQTIQLGCGLIRIGRVWGVSQKPVPSEKEALTFLESAYSMGIRFFDTAPSYGLSEERLGKFLSSLPHEERKKVTVATKFGERWNAEKQEAYIDHSYESSMLSIEKSFSFLGSIDVLQLHKASVKLLENVDISRVFDQAKAMGVKNFGVSVSDIETGKQACSDMRFSFIQLPYNKEKTDLLPVIHSAIQRNTQILFNRPFGMGALVDNPKAAYAFIIDTKVSGYILTGTASVAHLKENSEAFQSVQTSGEK